MTLQPLFFDFESYYDDEYSLKKITPIEYVADPRFEALGCGFVDLAGNKEWVDGPDLPRKFAAIDWANTFAISHNALFDALILSHVYKIWPAFYGDSMSMARNWVSHHTGSVALDAVSAFFGFPPKMKTVQKTKGINFHQLRQMPELYAETKIYAVDDAEKCKGIFLNIIADGFPPHQLKVIDWVIRMVTQPKFIFDQEILAQHLGEVQAKKQELLDRAGLENRDNLMRDEALAAMLLFAGVSPPMKRSKTTGLDIWAFAKTDKAFTALLEHDNPQVQALVAARLGHKSTLEETRTERLISVARCTPLAPVPLKYSGAHTHRFSGDWKINLQNLGRGSKLRFSMKAPKGYVVVSVDASQIEARINATLSGQWDLVEQFRRGEDVYALFAQTIYQLPLVTKQQHPTERFVGKTGILSLGYGSSWPVFQNMCRIQGNVQLKDGEAMSIVSLYRSTYPNIVANWEHADKVVIPIMSTGQPAPVQSLMQGLLPAGPPDVAWRAWGPVGIERYALRLPSGNRLQYRDLKRELNQYGKWQWVFMRGSMPVSTYGAKIVENVTQALAFIHIEEVAIRVKEMTNNFLIPSHQVHDELLFVVEEKIAEMVRDLVVKEMSTAPTWMPNAPLAAEGHIGESYGDTK